MNAKEKIAKLQKEIDALQPKQVDLIRINGVPQKIVGQRKLVDISGAIKMINGKWINMRAIPLIEVVERAK